MAEFETPASSHDVPATTLQQQDPAGFPATAADTEQFPLPVEGERNYGYPDDFMMFSFKKKACPRLDDCQCSHSAFEFWLHPDRYRTSMCAKGQTCTRPVCFFAHSQEELRPLPEGLRPAELEPGPSSSSSSKHRIPSNRPQNNPGILQAAVTGGGLGYLEQQQQPQLLLQPGMQLMPLSPAAAAPAAGFTPLGYVPVVQPGAGSGMALPYGQLPGGVVMMPPSQQQQFILQPALQQLSQQQGLEQQFQGLAIAPAAAGPLVDAPGSTNTPWQLQQQLLQPQQHAMLMTGEGAVTDQAATQHPQQQLLYMPSAAGSGPWAASAQQQQHLQGSGAYAYASASSSFATTYLEYGVSNQPQQHYSSPGFPGIFAGAPVGLQGGTVLAGNLGPGMMGPASAGFTANVPHLVHSSMQGQQPHHDNPGW